MVKTKVKKTVWGVVGIAVAYGMPIPHHFFIIPIKNPR